jgi:hypothetical protein
MSATPYNTANTAEWVYQEPRKNPKNGLNVYVQESTRCARNPRVQLEKCRAPFGVQDGMEESSRKNLELAVVSEEMKPWAVDRDEQNIGWITANCPALFKKEMKRNTVEALYRTLLTPPSNAAYSPLMRIKINSGGRQPTNVMVVLEDGTETTPMRWRRGTIADITPHSEVLPIVEVVGLWFVSKGCGMTMVATDLLVYPTQKRGFDFQLGFSAVRCDDDESKMPEPEASVFAAPSVLTGSVSPTPAEAEADTNYIQQNDDRNWTEISDQSMSME